MPFSKSLFTVLIALVQVWGFSQKTSLLWEISGNGLEKPSYLFGTIHIKDKRAFNFNDSVKICLNKSDAFASEIKMEELQSPAVIESFMAKEGEKIKDILTAEEYKNFGIVFEEITGQNVAIYNNFKPFLHYSLLCAALYKNDYPTVVDQYLSDEAKKLGKPLLSVEKLETQLKLLDLITKKELVAFIDEKDSIVTVFESLIKAYEQEDILKIEALMNATTDKENAKMMKSLIDDRNKSMAISIDKMIQKQTIFIAIGAGHLPKENGVIALLQKQGYKVRPIIASKK